MKIDAVSVSSSNLKKTVQFYTLLGFTFHNFKDDEDHLEPTTLDGSAKLMIDSEKMVRNIIGENPKPGNHSSFAIQYDSPSELNEVVEKLKEQNFIVVKEPWDAFWGQRYAIVQDPDGYKVDLYAALVG